MLFLSVITHTAPIYGLIYQLSENFFYLKLFLNAVVTLTVLVLPTIAMGTTLPLLVNHYSRQLSDFKSVVSFFYAINTLGGAFAALISGFYLINLLGVNNSILLAAAMNIDSAFSHFNQVVSLNHPDNWNDVAVSAKMLAEINLGRKNYKAAVDYCDKAISVLPDFGEAYTLRGIAQYWLNNRADSKMDFEKALSINPNDPTALQFLAEINSSAGKK